MTLFFFCKNSIVPIAGFRQNILVIIFKDYNFEVLSWFFESGDVTLHYIYA